MFSKRSSCSRKLIRDVQVCRSCQACAVSFISTRCIIQRKIDDNGSILVFSQFFIWVDGLFSRRFVSFWWWPVGILIFGSRILVTHVVLCFVLGVDSPGSTSPEFVLVIFLFVFLTQQQSVTTATDIIACITWKGFIFERWTIGI